MSIPCTAVSLRGLPLFSLLDEMDLAAIQLQTELRNYARGSEIIRSGETADGIYILLSGTVDVLLQDNCGHSVIVNTLHTNETFNEAALFTEGESRLTYVATRASQTLFVPREALRDALDRNCKLAMFIAVALAQRLEHAYRKLHVFGLEDVYTRVLDIVLTRGYEQDGAWHVNVGAGTMSEIVGASREMVSRVTKDLVKRELVTRQKRRLVVPDRAALEDWAEERRNKSPEKKRGPLQVRPVRSTSLEIAAT